MKRLFVCVLMVVGLAIGVTPANATLIGGPDIIAAPAFAIDDAPGAENDHQQAFDEKQDVLLGANLAVDGGFIAAGTRVNSHMIFLNTAGTARTDDLGVLWTFAHEILGVMSDSNGNLEAASNSILGAAGTIYPGAFAARGMEGADKYTVALKQITVDMVVTEPGDWIRVVTAVPEPSTIILLGAGLIGLAIVRKKRSRV